MREQPTTEPWSVIGGEGQGPGRAPHGGILDVNDLVGLVAPAPTFSIANARVHVTARLTARYREVLRTSRRARIIEAARPCTPLGTAGSSLSRVASPPILARRATPPTGKHGPLPPALDFYAPRLSSLTRAEGPSTCSNLHHMQLLMGPT